MTTADSPSAISVFRFRDHYTADQRIALDLDEDAKVNYAKFGPGG